MADKDFVLAYYPDAFAQESGGKWDISINSQEGLVESQKSEAEAWKAASNQIRSIKMRLVEENSEQNEPCRYCSGNCDQDHNNACDGFLGDIDDLYFQEET